MIDDQRYLIHIIMEIVEYVRKYMDGSSQNMQSLSSY